MSTTEQIGGATYIPSSRSNLPISKEEAQLQLTQKDLDLRGVAMMMRGKKDFNFEEGVLGGDVERTIDGASTVTLRIIDRERIFRNSGYLQTECDIKIDGLYFRLVRVEKDGDLFTLTFEDREVSIMRTYDEPKMVEWGKVSRQWFIWNMVKEPKEFKPSGIPVTIEDLQKSTPITKSGETVFLPPPGVRAVDRDFGLEQSYVRDPTRPGQMIPYLTVKGRPADQEQITNAEIILNTALGVVGLTSNRLQKIATCAIMTAITESTIHNYIGGDDGSTGVFQQIPGMGWPASHNVAADAAGFLKAAVAYDKLHPNAPYWLLCADVQKPAEENRKEYAKWRSEASHFVLSFGISGGTPGVPGPGVNNMNWSLPKAIDYQYTRGTPGEDETGQLEWDKENTWDCTGRMADEVNWRRFMVSGRFYFVSEPYLFKSKPRVVLSEKSPGVDEVNFTYDVGQKNAQVTVNARIDRWKAPPGTIAWIQDEGPINGKWLVDTVSRPLFSNNGKITLKKPRPKLPEPTKEELENRWGDAVGGDDDYLEPNTPDPGAGAPGAGGYVNPVKTPRGPSAFGNIDPEGAPDRYGVRHHAGLDWMAPGGAKVFSPAGGKIVEVRTAADVAAGSSNPNQVFGGVVKVEMPNGLVWVFRHVDPYGPLKVGATVQAGTVIATIFNGPTSTHTHIEVWKSLDGGYRYENMLDPAKVLDGTA
jgi:murein DD-endopeptidase MepM/ murein hydrolase activator NlpD